MAAGMELVRPESLRHHIENVLRQAIMSGRFAPGARLVERELCESLGVSRTSVREALRSLEAEKLVRTVPHTALTYWDGQYVAIDQNEDNLKLAEVSVPSMRALREI